VLRVQGLKVAMLAATAALLIVPIAAGAQTVSNTTSGTTTPGSGTVASSGTTYSPGHMWGTAGSGGGGGTDSATLHDTLGQVAGQVNASKIGALIGNGPSYSVTAIGSQNIVATTVYGNNSSAVVNATQTSTNTGTVSNNGSIANSP
jgi:hypothetical protein